MDTSRPRSRQTLPLDQRLSQDVLDNLIQRYTAGASATALARELHIAPSALLRLLRSRDVTIRTSTLSDEQTQQIAAEYKAGATMAELEAKHGLSHGTVWRAVHRATATEN